MQPLLITYAALGVGDPRRAPLREQLVSDFLPLASNLAIRYRNRGEPFDDLSQVACIGLMHAIDRYRPELGFSFLSLAVPTITGEIRRHFRDRTWAVRVPRRLKDLHRAIRTAIDELSPELGRAPRPSEIAARLGISRDEVWQSLRAAEAYQVHSLDQLRDAGSDAGISRLDQLGEPDPGMELVTDCHSLAPALAELPQRERTILIMRFFQDMTQTQIAEQVGVSQMHISRILAATLAHLRAVVTDTEHVTDADLSGVGQW